MDIFWLVIFSLSLLCLHGHSQAILHEEPDFECVDIYKQPAFRHPLLKNHKIQMKAMTRMMKRLGIDKKADKDKNQTGVFGTSRDLCPDGQVPIHKQKTQNQTYHMTSKDFPGQYFAALETGETYRDFRGASAVMSIHAPHVENNQYSRASIWVENGPADQRNSIQFGWAAHSRIYPDSRPRLTVFWTADGYKTGCYNTLCPGFVQVDKEYYVGMEVLPKDSNGGPDSLLKVSIVQNMYLDGRWMLMVQDKAIGYWPKEVFTHLSQGATFLRYGGNAFESPDHILPTMGNGIFPSFTAPYYTGSAFFTHCKLALENSRGLVLMKDISSAIMKVVVDDVICYRVNYFQDEISDQGQVFGYGGHCIPGS